MSYRDLLDERVTITRATQTLTTAGGVDTRVFTELATDVPCAIQTGASFLASTSDYQAGGLVAVATWNAFFLKDQDLAEADRIPHPIHGLLEVMGTYIVRSRFRIARLRLLTVPQVA